MTTKDQERKALDQIREIVAALGSDSYLAIAFEGCFEIAEENIQNDFGCSMKQRAESAEQKAVNLAAELKQTADLLAIRTEMLNRADKDAEAKILQISQDAAEQIRQLKQEVLSGDDLSDCLMLAENAQTKAEEAATAAAAEIVKLADDPGSEDFQSAVKTNRAQTRLAEYWGALCRRLADRLPEE